MLSGLLLSAFLMGLGGMAHCAAMCGVACSVAMPAGVSWMAMLGRSMGYALLGAVAAASAGLVAQLGRQVGFLQPFWVMLLASAVVLGFWLAATGRMPAWLDHWGVGLYHQTRHRWQRWAGGRAGAWWWPAWPLFAGMLWAFLPCGLLYAALMLSTLAPDALGGAAVMLAFSVPSAVGVWAAPWVLGKMMGRRQAPETQGASYTGASAIAPVLWMRPQATTTLPGTPLAAAPVTAAVHQARAGAWVDPRWAIRLAGLSMAAMAGWAISHHLWSQYQAWCA